ncbi:MAG: cyclic nucleotide-binding/CBS domain-containing protein [Candidatus Bathyarchaeia archaeon]
MSMKLQDIMVKSVVTVGARANVKKAVELMNKHEIGCLIVVERGKAVGIVTERDILKRVIPRSEPPEKIRVSKIMSKPLLVGKPQMDLSEAAELMFKKKIKKLPVAENGHLVGLVTLTDLVRSPNIMRWLENLPTEKAPKSMKNVINTYLDAENSGRKCPLVVEQGYMKRCLENKCMWWFGDECGITKLSRKMSDMKNILQT